MNSKIFWVSSSGGIFSCSVSACAATAQRVTPDTTDPVGPLVCDAKNDEVVWVVRAGSSFVFTVHRASENGSNSRPITSFMGIEADGADWRFANETGKFSNSRADRIFVVRNDLTANSATLYYVSTEVPNGSRVSVATTTGTIPSSGSPVLANDSAVITTFYPTSITLATFVAPLPDGIISSAPPRFADGGAAGVLDQSSFYGTIGGTASDAIVRCPLSDCLNPTVISRGQAGAFYFAQDGTAVYWTRSHVTTGQGFDVWKMAK
jgi:hypothetical protein